METVMTQKIDPLCKLYTHIYLQLAPIPKRSRNMGFKYENSITAITRTAILAIPCRNDVPPNMIKAPAAPHKQ